MYARTEEEFKTNWRLLETDDISLLYPQYLNHLKKSYGHRIDSWALYRRIDLNLPTRGSNTTAYAEASMLDTKQNQFGRVRTFNLPELLSVLFGTSERYQNKCTEVGHNRDNQQRNKGKYRGKESKLGKENIVDLGENNFMVQSESKPEVFFSVDMKSGFCSCPVGITCAPCKHKSSISKFYGVAEFSVVPQTDPCQRALYHFLA